MLNNVEKKNISFVFVKVNFPAAFFTFFLALKRVARVTLTLFVLISRSCFDGIFHDKESQQNDLLTGKFERKASVLSAF